MTVGAVSQETLTMLQNAFWAELGPGVLRVRLGVAGEIGIGVESLKARIQARLTERTHSPHLMSE